MRKSPLNTSRKLRFPVFCHGLSSCTRVDDERRRLQCLSPPTSLITYRRRQRPNSEDVKTAQNNMKPYMRTLHTLARRCYLRPSTHLVSEPCVMAQVLCVRRMHSNQRLYMSTILKMRNHPKSPCDTNCKGCSQLSSTQGCRSFLNTTTA